MFLLLTLPLEHEEAPCGQISIGRLVAANTDASYVCFAWCKPVSNPAMGRRSVGPDEDVRQLRERNLFTCCCYSNSHLTLSLISRCSTLFTSEAPKVASPWCWTCSCPFTCHRTPSKKPPNSPFTNNHTRVDTEPTNVGQQGSITRLLPNRTPQCHKPCTGRRHPVGIYTPQYHENCTAMLFVFDHMQASLWRTAPSARLRFGPWLGGVFASTLPYLPTYLPTYIHTYIHT